MRGVRHQMTDDSHFAHEQLNLAAAQLAEEIWAKRWEHVADLKVKPVGECVQVVAELEKRCPGFSASEYSRALARGMLESR